MKLLPPPGPARTRQLILLAILLPTLAYILYTSFGSSGMPTASVPPPAPARTQTTSTVPNPSTPVNGPSSLPEAVRLAALEPVSEGPEFGRNPFAFGQKPVPPPPPPPPPPPYVPPPPPPPPPPPAIPLQYLGYWTNDPKAGPPLGAFKDKGGTLIHVSEGQTIDGRYKVLKLTEHSALVSYMDGTNAQTLMKGR
jgi:hypothetical protein